MRRGDFVDALAQFQRLSTRYPDDARFWIRQGDCLNMLNMYTQALDCFDFADVYAGQTGSDRSGEAAKRSSRHPAATIRSWAAGFGTA